MFTYDLSGWVLYLFERPLCEYIYKAIHIRFLSRLFYVWRNSLFEITIKSLLYFYNFGFGFFSSCESRRHFKALTATQDGTDLITGYLNYLRGDDLISENPPPPTSRHLSSHHLEVIPALINALTTPKRNIVHLVVIMLNAIRPGGAMA